MLTYLFWDPGDPLFVPCPNTPDWTYQLFMKSLLSWALLNPIESGNKFEDWNSQWVDQCVFRTLEDSNHQVAYQLRTVSSAGPQQCSTEQGVVCRKWQGVIELYSAIFAFDFFLFLFVILFNVVHSHKQNGLFHNCLLVAVISWWIL